jgi:hypothetical protein
MSEVFGKYQGIYSADDLGHFFSRLELAPFLASEEGILSGHVELDEARGFLKYFGRKVLGNSFYERLESCIQCSEREIEYLEERT